MSNLSLSNCFALLIAVESATANPNYTQNNTE